MFDSADWLRDPFVTIDRPPPEISKPQMHNDKLVQSWWTFHFATRLKLDGAAYFCRQVFGAVSMPDHIGLSLLSHRQEKWYLDAFFFELMAACDTLLQELNVLYLQESALDMDKVTWEKMKERLPKNLVKYIEDKYKEDWFIKLRYYRNTATHHAYVPTSSTQFGSGHLPFDYDEYEVKLVYVSKDKAVFTEDIDKCRIYLEKMVGFIGQVWNLMAEGTLSQSQ